MNNILSKYVFSILVTASVSTSAHAVSLGSISSWFSSWQEESFFQEATCCLNGTLELSNISGPITIKTWTIDKIVIEATKSAKEKDLPNIIIETDIKEHHAYIKTVYQDKQTKGSVSYSLIIPEHMNVTLHTDDGAITLKKVRGNIHAYTLSGSIDIEEASRSITAHSTSGNITASCSNIPLNAHVQLTTDNGTITLALPKRTHAHITAKALKGTITSEQSITVAPQTVKLDRHYWKRVRTEISGLLGNGGASIELTSLYGNIKIVEH